MRNMMIIAAVLVGLGSFMAQMADKMTPAPALAKRIADKSPRAERSRRPAAAASAFPATPAAISRPTAASTASASTSWSTPAPRWWR